MSDTAVLPSPPPISYEPILRNRPRYLWPSFLLVAILLAIPYLLGYAIYYPIYYLFTGGATYTEHVLAYRRIVTPISFRLSVYILMIGTNMAALAPFLFLTRAPLRSRLSIRKPSISPIATAVLVLGSVSLSVLNSSLIAMINLHSGALARLHQLIAAAATQNPFLCIFAIGVLAPVTEEILFRGYIQTRLIRRLGPLWGILLTSSLFGIFHRDPVHALVAFIMGLYLGAVSYSAGTILPSILCHIAVNTFAVLLVFTNNVPFLQSPILVAAACISCVAASCLLAKTAPPGYFYRRNLAALLPKPSSLRSPGI